MKQKNNMCPWAANHSKYLIKVDLNPKGKTCLAAQ